MRWRCTRERLRLEKDVSRGNAAVRDVDSDILGGVIKSNVLQKCDTYSMLGIQSIAFKPIRDLR